jgi:ribosomal protein S18 acetylase RimI-like enzyme
MELDFKKCTGSDLEELIEIAKTTFINAFEKDNDPVDFKAYINSAFESNTIKAQLENTDSYFYFVFMDEQLVGYFKLNVSDAQTDIKTEEAIELERIYVRQEFQGQQIGKLMLNEAKSLAAEKNKKYIWLGVWENNHDAIRFYQKHEFTKFATHPYFVGTDEQTDWLLKCELNHS